MGKRMIFRVSQGVARFSAPEDGWNESKPNNVFDIEISNNLPEAEKNKILDILAAHPSAYIRTKVEPLSPPPRSPTQAKSPPSKVCYVCLGVCLGITISTISYEKYFLKEDVVPLLKGTTLSFIGGVLSLFVRNQV